LTRVQYMAAGSRYDGLMKSIIIASVLFAGAVWAADEVSDRAMIESTIRAFSLMPGREALYTSDFDRDELVRFGKAPVATTDDVPIPITIEGVPGTVVISKEPMGEAEWFPPGMQGRANVVIVVKRIRFVTADVAMVDVVRNGPGFIVMKKVGADWKIASVRRVAE
jgi:hypothetical protein